MYKYIIQYLTLNSLNINRNLHNHRADGEVEKVAKLVWHVTNGFKFILDNPYSYDVMVVENV